MIKERLFDLQDEKYRDFQSSLCPTVEPDRIIGVRTPALRSFAKELIKSGEAAGFMENLPHYYFEENQLHAFIISEMKSFEEVIKQLDIFLPYVDNWATCDQLRPKVFKKHRDGLIGSVRRWMTSGDTYTIRFGVGMLMQHYLDEDFKPEYLDWVCDIRSDEYYVNMMLAWYFATALAKQYDLAVEYLTENRLDLQVHNKTIQKAVESLRISDERKEYLKTLRIKAV